MTTSATTARTTAAITHCVLDAVMHIVYPPTTRDERGGLRPIDVFRRGNVGEVACEALP
jgi:hypothetical protein